MLLSLIRSGGDYRDIIATALILIPMVLIALTVHEVAHGYVAYLCGDSTAKSFGRLSANPLHHLDPVGTICLLFAGFGWAKPVPVITRNFKKPRRDMFLVAMAGPLSNLILAFLLTPVLMLLFRFYLDAVAMGEEPSRLLTTVYDMVSYGVGINISLAVFNLIPLPPLDGSNMLITALPPKLGARYAHFMSYGGTILFAVIMISNFTSFDILAPLAWINGAITDLFVKIFWFIVAL